jgi:hypothetical protein
VGRAGELQALTKSAAARMSIAAIRTPIPGANRRPFMTTRQGNTFAAAEV